MTSMLMLVSDWITGYISLFTVNINVSYVNLNCWFRLVGSEIRT